VLAIWKTHCQHPDVSILLYRFIDQRNIKLCWVTGWERESMGKKEGWDFPEEESH